MAKIDVFNVKREKVGEMDLADEVFATEVKDHLMHAAVAPASIVYARECGAQLVCKRLLTQPAINCSIRSSHNCGHSALQNCAARPQAAVEPPSTRH